MIGRILNHRYRVTNLIGTGGMAHVYRAVNLGTRKSVAIKVLKEEYKDNPEFLRRFEREARAVLHLSHDNIVRAYGVGQEDGLPFIVLEYVEGRTLKQIIQDEGPLPPKEAIELAYQVLDALSAAHEAGIIHRDIKPQNVIVTRGGKAKLTDFGIAREAASNTVTYAGPTVLGSVHYLSPEQAKGKSVTAESDLYSTGVMLYEMLCGEVPFSGDSSVAIALKHISEKPEALVERNPMISPALSDVVMKALSKNAADRYQSAAAMRSDLLRAQYEPYGDFARLPAKQSGSQSGKGKQPEKRRRLRVTGTFWISVGVTAMLAAFFILFALSRKAYQAEAVPMQIVPALTDRSIEEAAAKAEDYGFLFEVQDYEVSDTVQYGNVIRQTPESGLNAKAGSVIYGVISLGPDIPTIPNLVGMTPDEALAALTADGLKLGSTGYRVSDVALGYVCEQSPIAGLETQPGSVVDIWISSDSDESLTMPQLTGETFADALALLGEGMFTSIRVREMSEPALADGFVLSQTPTSGETVWPKTPVELTVNVTHEERYFADIAFNLDIEASGTPVLVAIAEAANGVAYERVLYETTLEKGQKVPVSFTASADTSGTMDVILYVNNVIVRRQDASFAAKAPAA